MLYTNYERQVEALFAGHIHVAWNSPLAWLQCGAHRAGTGPARRGHLHARYRPRPDFGDRGARRRPGARHRRFEGQARGRGRQGLAAGDADSALLPGAAGPGARSRFRGRGVRQTARQARRPHRRRARRGARADARRMRCRLHDRRQPSAVHAGRHASAGRHSRIIAQTPRLRPLQLHRARRRAPAASVARFRELLLEHVLRGCRGAPAARSGGAEAVAAGPHRRIRTARRAAVEQFGYLEPFVSAAAARCT